MGDHACWECRQFFTDPRQLEEHAQWYGHQAYIERTLRRKKKKDEGPSQEEIDATLASIADALGETNARV